MDIRQLTEESATKAATRIFVLLAILALWNMSEGAFILYYREARAKSEKARGFGVVTLALAALTLLTLPLLRTKVSQPVFVIALAALALRGVARSWWEQDKALPATAATWFGHSLLALLSFALIQEPILWQSVVVSFALGSALTPADMAWHKSSLLEAPHHRQLSAALRVLLFSGPVCLATLALAGHLPQRYLAIWITLFIAHKIANGASSSGALDQLSFRGATLFYAAVLGTLYLCNAYQP
jgi:hypothetical protein